MKKTLTTTAILGVVSMFAEAATVSTYNSPLVINFDETVTGSNNGKYTGAGFAPTPGSGQLNSNAWRITGFGTSVDFGGTGTSGDPARGTSDGGISSGGVYAFNTSLSDHALGVQPGGSDFTPGTITLRVENNTGATINTWSLGFDLFVLNNEDRSNSLNWDYSTDDTVYTTLSTYTSDQGESTSPTWSNVQNVSSSNISASVANGGFLFLRWSGDDVGGTGSRDEFAIDNISVTAIPEPSSCVMLGLGAMAFLLYRRK
jgi:hypothetical protein